MDILSDTFDKSKDNELIYLASIICYHLMKFEDKCKENVALQKTLLYDPHLQSIFDLKDKWIEKLLPTAK